MSAPGSPLLNVTARLATRSASSGRFGFEIHLGELREDAHVRRIQVRRVLEIVQRRLRVSERLLRVPVVVVHLRGFIARLEQTLRELHGEIGPVDLQELRRQSRRRLLVVRIRFQLCFELRDRDAGRFRRCGRQRRGDRRRRRRCGRLAAEESTRLRVRRPRGERQREGEGEGDEGGRRDAFQVGISFD